MRSSHMCGRALATSLIAFGIGLAFAPTASADPNDAADPEPAAPGPVASAPTISTQVSSEDGSSASASACKVFGLAMNYAAINYEDFAYATAGAGNYVNYGDPQVTTSNLAGRTALRQAAATVFNASTTPGLQPEISGPMQSWSLNATRLILTMGLSGGGDALNSAATDLNNDARNVQLACAAAGTHA